MGKGHRVATKKKYVLLLYSRTMNNRFERKVRRDPVFAEMVRLYGLVYTEKLLIECPRTDRVMPGEGGSPADIRRAL